MYLKRKAVTDTDNDTYHKMMSAMIAFEVGVTSLSHHLTLIERFEDSGIILYSTSVVSLLRSRQRVEGHSERLISFPSIYQTKRLKRRATVTFNFNRRSDKSFVHPELREEYIKSERKLKERLEIHK